MRPKSTDQRMIRDLDPIPGIPYEELVLMSRQQRYKLRRYAQGRCTSCGKAQRAERSRSLCPECLAVQRERMRARSGAGRRNFRAASYDDIPAPTPVPAKKSATSARPARPGPQAKASRRRADEPPNRRR